MNCPGSAACDIEVFFDGACPLCRREAAFLRRWDRRGRIRFTDISSPDFEAVSVGKTDHALMAQIHGRLPDGTWLQGVDVFRRLYAAVGFGPLVFLSRLPLISQLLNWGYAVFARNRLRKMYEPGLWGPVESTDGMEQQGRSWFDTCPVLH